MRRIGIYGPAACLALVACASALTAAGARPCPRVDQHFNPHPSQREQFDGVIVVEDTPFTDGIADHYEGLERPVSVFLVSADPTAAELAAMLEHFGLAPSAAALTEGLGIETVGNPDAPATDEGSEVGADDATNGTEVPPVETPDDDANPPAVVTEEQPSTDPTGTESTAPNGRQRTTRSTRSRS